MSSRINRELLSLTPVLWRSLAAFFAAFLSIALSLSTAFAAALSAYFRGRLPDQHLTNNGCRATTFCAIDPSDDGHSSAYRDLDSPLQEEEGIDEEEDQSTGQTSYQEPNPTTPPRPL
ncbi:hypothetical protein BKA64DRAFT_645703 [Cadophora sp. MPI-SDFR-AT-0126]|nr:hypothetical protein BKA64DRAFT_645703 [Leotiomycetes sp. MPI-SDFR-AT-0126]